MATTDDAGVLTTPTGTFQYDPFGKVLATGGFSTPPNGAGSDSMAYLGQYGKLTSTNTTNHFTQMGARLYIPTLGRFAQVDPVEGGTENNYVYPTDPVNSTDLTGQWIETALDLGSFAYSTNEFRKKQSWSNFGWAVFDGVAIFAPIVPGSGAARAAIKAEKISRTMKSLDLSAYYRAHAGQAGKLISKRQIAETLVNGDRYVDIRNGRSVKYDGKYAVIHEGNKIISAHRYSKISPHWKRIK